MNMKRLLTLVAFFATLHASAQQVNPVPDYVFANRMSAGRNTVTDTAAYFSIGPRYGATRGMMPPMVVDTASFSGNKRNGLLIFSIQKNKFLYWDSVGVKWAEMAGTAGTALTSADTAALLSTRAWRQKGIDSLAAIRISGSGTTNYVPKFTASTALGNSQIFDNGTSVGIGTASPNASYLLEAVKNGDVIFNLRTTSATGNPYIRAQSTTTNVYSAGMAQSTGTSVPFVNDGAFNYTNGTGGMQIITGTATPIQYFTNNTERLRIFGNGRVFIGASPSDAGFQLDINGTARVQGGSSTASALFTSTPTIGGIDVANTGTLANTRISQIRLINGTTTLGANDRTYQLINIGESATASAFALQYWNGTGNAELFRINSSGELLYGTAADAGAYAVQIVGNLYNTGSITTGAPSGGSIKPWKIGEAATVSPTSPNRTLRVEVDGVVYYIHAKTTND